MNKLTLQQEISDLEQKIYLEVYENRNEKTLVKEEYQCPYYRTSKKSYQESNYPWLRSARYGIAASQTGTIQ